MCRLSSGGFSFSENGEARKHAGGRTKPLLPPAPVDRDLNDLYRENTNMDDTPLHLSDVHQIILPTGQTRQVRILDRPLGHLHADCQSCGQRPATISRQYFDGGVYPEIFLICTDCL